MDGKIPTEVFHNRHSHSQFAVYGMGCENLDTMCVRRLGVVRETHSRALFSVHTVRKVDLRLGPGGPQGRMIVLVRRKRLVVVVMREGLV